jgi:signal transduction histidine kinase
LKVAKVKLFNRATLKLTAIYTGVLLFLSVGFSVAVGITATREMNQPLNQPPRVVLKYDENREEFEQIFRARANQASGRIALALILINFGVMVLGAGLSFLLARWTLKPIEQAMNSQSRFVSDASHELKTPLAALAMENEVTLRDKTAGKKELLSQIKSNLEEVRKLQKLSDTLLQISQNRAVTEAKERQAIIEQIVKILTENAIKHDPKHRPPKIERTDKEIRVIDEGTGIAEQDLPHIFERFYRAEKSRTSDGYGLGLSLAKHLAEKISAEIKAENNRGAGATFTLKF